MKTKREGPAVAASRGGVDSFRLLVEGVRDYAIFGLDGAGRVSTWNAGAERIKGYREDEIVGRHFSRFYPPEAVAAGMPARLLALAARDGRVEDEGWRVRKDGSRFWANVIITAVRDHEGAVVGFAKVTRDLTERKAVEDALRRSEQTFQLLVDSIQNYAVFMLDPDGRVASWNAGAERINGYAQALFQDHAAQLDAEGKRLLTVIRDSAKLGGELIDALLNFSRVGRQPLARTPVDLNALVESVVTELGRDATGIAVETVIHPMPPVTGDPALLRQVLANVIANAFKFTGRRPHPRVEIGAQTERSEVVYYVKDNGVGFDMRYADKLFGVFQRLHRGDEFEGTGVGLALAQRIIQRHGGRIWAEGKVNEGATFFFTLPTVSGER